MSRLSRIDPCGPALAAVAAVVFLLHGFGGPLGLDVALYTYSAQQLAEGVPPYVAVLNRAGPLAHVVPGLGALAGEALGVQELLAMRVTLAAVSVLCVWAMYLLGRDALGSRVAGAVAATVLLLFQGFVEYAAWGPREKTTMLLFLVLSLWLLGTRRWWWAGVTVALATLSWQGVFFPLAAAGLVALAGERDVRRVGGAVARIAAGGLLVTAVTAASFVAVGAFPEFYEGFLGIHLGGFSTGTGVGGLLAFFDTVSERLLNGFGWSLWLGIAGLVALLLTAAVRRSRWMLTLASGAVVCLLWSLFAFEGWPDAFLFLPFAAVGVAAVVQLLLAALPDRWETPAAVVLVVLALVGAGSWSALTRSTALVGQREQVASVVALAGPGATVQSIGAPRIPALLELRNPIRYQVFTGGVGRYLDQTLPGGLDGVARDVEERRPTFVVVNAPQRYPWLRPVLSEHYRHLGRSQRVTWFVANTVPTQDARQMRTVLRGGAASARPSGVGSSQP